MFAYFWLRNQEKRQKTTKKEATGQQFRDRTPTPKPDTEAQHRPEVRPAGRSGQMTEQ